MRQEKDPVALMQPKEGETKRDCWAVAFGEISRVIISLFSLSFLTEACLFTSLYSNNLPTVNVSR